MRLAAADRSVGVNAPTSLQYSGRSGDGGTELPLLITGLGIIPAKEMLKPDRRLLCEMSATR